MNFEPSALIILDGQGSQALDLAVTTERLLDIGLDTLKNL